MKDAALLKRHLTFYDLGLSKVINVKNEVLWKSSYGITSFFSNVSKLNGFLVESTVDILDKDNQLWLFVIFSFSKCPKM